MNPLLEQGDLPDFTAITAEQVVPAVREAIRMGKEQLKALENLPDATWATFVVPLRQVTRRLDRVWGVVNHLMGVKNSAALRAAHETVQGEVVEFQLSLGQSRALFERWQLLEKKASTELTTSARKRIVAAALRDAKLAGVALEGAAQQRFNAIQRELAELATRYSNAVLDATKEFQLLLTHESEIAGLPQSYRTIAAQSARTHGHKEANAEKGPYLVTLDFPSYYPFLQHAENRELREQVYRATTLRASGTGYSQKWNNWPLIDAILKLRREEAVLLGFKNFAEVSLAAKMAPNTTTIKQMIAELAAVARPAAKREFAELADFAHAHGFTGELKHWDIAYFSERRREELYNFTDEELRPYFPLPKVLSGLFALAEKLFAVSIRQSVKSVPKWHADVEFFEVFDNTGKQIAAFYLDPYARSGEKRGGAWMDVCRQREILSGDGSTTLTEQIILPVAYLVCNGTPPVAGESPSLMTFTEVETLFHEFGHGLQHMLTRVDEYEAAGIANVEWDAVELPSQFMENWVYERSVIDQISGHYQTGELLPQALFEKIIAAKNYMAASQMLRQLYFSLLDIELYENANGGALVGAATDGETPTALSVRDIQKRIAADYTVLAPLPDDAFLCSFSHIFAGGYAAGYYSYKWAEVLSADAFAAFEEAGLENPATLAKLGARYRETILGLGGSEHPMAVYRKFRGRDATIDALLMHNGLKPNRQPVP
ncbi:MAG: M3 family metallopeptidase [Spirochaetes bacterium]|nr:M3 family metallopeptidase [Spirochaetota bacterium]